MDNDIILIYGTKWCGDCWRARRFFDKYKIPYEWIDIDKDECAEKFVLTKNNGNRSVPTILFTDGSILVEPSTKILATKFDI